MLGIALVIMNWRRESLIIVGNSRDIVYLYFEGIVVRFSLELFVLAIIEKINSIVYIVVLYLIRKKVG